MMNVRDKWIVAILIVLVVLTGLTYYGFTKHNDTATANTSDVQPTTTIVVNGNGSSGTGDVQNVQQVTQVQAVGSGEPTKTVYVKQEAEQLSGNEYTPESGG